MAEVSYLGFHKSHDSSLCLATADGKMLFTASEERFTRKKLQAGIPYKAKEYLLEHYKLGPVVVCYGGLKVGPRMQREAAFHMASLARGLNTPPLQHDIGKLYGRLLGQGKGVDPNRPKLFDGLDIQRVVHVDHHDCHAAGAYYQSGFEESLVFTLDGLGDCFSAGFYRGQGSRLERVRAWYHNDVTVGEDYEMMTALLGFNPHRHPGKITGLAAFGAHNPECIDQVRSFFKRVWKKGSRNFFYEFHTEMEESAVAELRRIRDTTFGKYSREDMAFAIQHIAEEDTVALIRGSIPDPQNHNICLAGGVFANVKLNKRVHEMGFRNVFVQPAMNDAGLATGAVLAHLGQEQGLRPYRLENVYGGPGYSNADAARAIESFGLAYEVVEPIEPRIARLLADGHVVARFEGRMEFGPRALGHRSILYAAKDPTVNTWLNNRLNRTEFMPFAPSTLMEHAGQCFEGVNGAHHAAQFMTITFDCTPFFKENCPAAVHIDGTARPQLVTKEDSPSYYRVIDEFRKLTGVPAVINTSFNMHEEPIVMTPEDAVRAFMDGHLDYLAIENCLVKNPEPGSTA
jgi:carbamoyltransferase